MGLIFSGSGGDDVPEIFYLPQTKLAFFGGFRINPFVPFRPSTTV